MGDSGPAFRTSPSPRRSSSAIDTARSYTPATNAAIVDTGNRVCRGFFFPEAVVSPLNTVSDRDRQREHEFIYILAVTVCRHSCSSDASASEANLLLVTG